MRGNPALNAGTIHKSNPEHLLFLRLHLGTMQETNPEQLLVLRLHAWTIHEFNLGGVDQ